MTLRAVVGFFFTCITGESWAFVALPSITAASTIVASQKTTATTAAVTNVQLMMMGKKGGGNKKRRRQPGPFRDSVEEKEEEGIAAGQEGGDARGVPRLVVMDLDYTLW